MLDIIYISFIGFSMLCGLVFTKKSSHIAYKIFLFFLVVTFCNELSCYFIKSYTSTIIFYNIYYYFRFPILCLVYQKLFDRRNRFRLYVGNAFYVISLLLFFFCLYWYNGLSKQLHTIYFCVGAIFIIINCLMLFYQSLKSEDISNPFNYHFFLISVALFLYFLGNLPFLGIFNFMSKRFMDAVPANFVITKSLSIMLYSLISADYFLQWTKLKLISLY